MEYPVIECKEANLGFFNTVFPLIFAVSFGFFWLCITIFIVRRGHFSCFTNVYCFWTDWDNSFTNNSL